MAAEPAIRDAPKRTLEAIRVLRKVLTTMMSLLKWHFA